MCKMIEVGSIVNGLVPDEPVVVISIRPMGQEYALRWIGKNSAQSGSRVLSKAELDRLEIVSKEGAANFSGDPEKFKLFAEAERIKSAYQFDPLFAINCSVVDALPHQVEAVYKFLLPQPKIRFLLADDTGAGKTIMTGLLLREMMMRGRLNRVLIVTPGGLTKQWRDDEMELKFNIPFVIANRAALSSEPNYFHTHDRVVTSIDFVCQKDVLSAIEREWWDMVVFDEAHKLSAYEYGTRTYRSRRYTAAEQLSRQCDHILLLTATPHRGRTDTFKRLLQLLDEDVFSTTEAAADRVNEFSKEGLNKFFLRRLKEDMQDWNGNPLYKARHTKTMAYELTPEEHELYDAVTEYLTKRKKDAEGNIHVSLALQVMQRRLVSSIFAIKNTLEKRYKALKELTEELAKNPELWNQRPKFDEEEPENIDEYDDLDDEGRDALDGIMGDPKKFRFFTTANNPDDIRKEAQEVEALYDKAKALFESGQEEQKFKKLRELLTSQGVVDGEKLVIFTEHKDTLFYLEDRLRSSGYEVATIHGGKDADERRAAQMEFMGDKAKILIATDAAGEGINLQFCKLLINWDIPWNPNRLEQRMGRIHRYGQEQEVLVFNMVADNTREGGVLKTLLAKIEKIRDDLGDDRVYDVIQDVFKGVPLEEVIKSVFDGENGGLDAMLQDDEALRIRFRNSIKEKSVALTHSGVDYKEAQRLKSESDERRLQPIYIKQFFEKAFRHLGGTYEEVKKGIYRITKVPERLQRQIKLEHNEEFFADELFCFDKHVFLDFRNKTLLAQPSAGKRAHYINPGNKLFDGLIAVVRNDFKDEMLKGTVLVSPEDSAAYFAHFVKVQISGNDGMGRDENTVLDERIALIEDDGSGNCRETSPAKLLDMVPPNEFAKKTDPVGEMKTDEIVSWAYQNIALELEMEVSEQVMRDWDDRKRFLVSGFDYALADIDKIVNDLQEKQWKSPNSRPILEKLEKMARQREELLEKKEVRLKSLGCGPVVSVQEPEVLGSAYVVPLTQVEYKEHFGMSRDDEVEAVAMKAAMDCETANGRTPKDVSKDNVGYDVQSVEGDGVTKRYIEVKGRSGTDGVMLSENEKNRLEQLGEKAWLYIVVDCKSSPRLFCFRDPMRNMQFEKRTKGVQFYLSLDEWQKTAEAAEA